MLIHHHRRTSSTNNGHPFINLISAFTTPLFDSNSRYCLLTLTILPIEPLADVRLIDTNVGVVRCVYLCLAAGTMSRFASRTTPRRAAAWSAVVCTFARRASGGTPCRRARRCGLRIAGTGCELMKVSRALLRSYTMHCQAQPFVNASVSALKPSQD